MKRTYTIWFKVGDTLSTWKVTASDIADAASKFKGSIVAITLNGYEVSKDG